MINRIPEALDTEELIRISSWLRHSEYMREYLDRSARPCDLSWERVALRRVVSARQPI